MKIHEDVIQRSEEWHSLRLGRVTGTRIKEMVTAKSSGFDTLCRKVAAEKITGVSCEKPFRISDAMQHGIDTEAEARREYEITTLQHVQEVGFVEKDDLFGISPDGLIGEDGGLELKCPQPQTHLLYMMAPTQAWKAYRWQLQGFLWVTERKWIDFASYCPSYSEDKRLLVNRVTPCVPDHSLIVQKAATLRECVKSMLEQVQ